MPEVLLANLLAGSGKLGNSACRCRLRSLASGIGVDFSVKHENVDVFA